MDLINRIKAKFLTVAYKSFIGLLASSSSILVPRHWYPYIKRPPLVLEVSGENLVPAIQKCPLLFCQGTYDNHLFVWASSLNCIRLRGRSMGFLSDSGRGWVSSGRSLTASGQLSFSILLTANLLRLQESRHNTTLSPQAVPCGGNEQAQKCRERSQELARPKSGSVGQVR